MSTVFHRAPKQTLPVAVAGEGIEIVDATGKRYIDACGGAAVSCLGHSNQRVIDAIRRQSQQLPYAHTSFFTTDVAEELADRLVASAPRGLEHVYFVSGGSEAIEAALKLARQYFVEKGELQRRHFIARRQSYHGNTLGALAIGGRGLKRDKQGRVEPARVENREVLLGYIGLDNVARNVQIAFAPEPDKLFADRADYTVKLPAQACVSIYLSVAVQVVAQSGKPDAGVPQVSQPTHALSEAHLSQIDAERPRVGRAAVRAALVDAHLVMRERRRATARVRTSNPLFNAWIDRSLADLGLLTTDLATGPYPYAGIPWFSTPFGRDAVITSLHGYGYFHVQLSIARIGAERYIWLSCVKGRSIANLASYPRAFTTLS